MDATPFVPVQATLRAVRDAATSCRGCPLWENATQTVFGEGPAQAAIMMVGEQPGDVEDRQGHPFVGPAGHLLDKCLQEAGLDRSALYLTNAVKHFKWEAAGPGLGRRLHKKPGTREVKACKPWLDAELDCVQPELVVCLGATAGQALLGPSFKLTPMRGRFMPFPGGRQVFATVHPSSLLRAPDADTRLRNTEQFVADLRAIAEWWREHLAGKLRSS